MAIIELQRFDERNDFETWWNQLLSNSLDNHPFLTYEWLTLWWKHFGKGKELKLFIVENEREASLVVPIMYSTCKVLGSRRTRAEFVASGDSDYQSFIVTNFQEATRGVNQLIESIMEDSNDADCVVFSEVPEDSVTARLLEGIKGQGFGASRSATNSCPYVLLPIIMRCTVRLWVRICEET